MPGISIIYYILFILVIGIIIFIIRMHYLKKKTIPVKLFVEALKNENSGEYETAVDIYNNALNEAKKLRGHSDLEVRIIEKLKLLNTVIEYKKGFNFSK